MQTRQLKPSKAPSDELTPIAEFAQTWEVNTKTVEKWTEIAYLAFDVALPKSGPFPQWGISLLNLVGKHISQKATLYFAETQEQRRLKGTELIRKIRHMREEGHFEEFKQFQKFQKSQNFQVPDEEDEDLDILAEMGSVARQQDGEMNHIKQVIEQREDEQIDALVDFMEQTEQRKKFKLANRLKQRQLPDVSTQQVVDISFRRLSGS